MKVVKSVLALAVVASMVSCDSKVKEVKSLETEIDSVSYAIGLSMSGQLRSGFKDVNKDILTQAIRNGLDSTNLLIDIKDIQSVISPYFQKKQAEEMQAQQAKAASEAEAKFGENKKAGIDFLAENKTKEGVITTDSGLQYIVLKEGNGDKPEGPTTKVKVHYHGTNIEGKVFDSSVDRGTPAEFGLNQVIKGWTEGVQLMNVGSKYKFFIPQELAYGAQQKGADIKPFSTLIFEVELLEITK
ncbi:MULTISPECIES: FKBP-type peptidyl-prolyl cis-trans isomerase [Polaribacter]|uniref:Peptidyl-prolyl cis-trans isomerase n=1 Tax=Polaribacter sejongensis TaxID=985043 RepID=A0AAJ1VG11_9FLAO|nr:MULTISPECIES: FKBP-type peptidyl-prolyl cis-trans isomerase [Polaribacter]AUC22956.1 peptidylprolyl isomerase [Polaribacter sejongensis]MDN3618764.1 FKBP-type peptidyl-prolyl cis-trans isomerase [Polaribacter undariae]UWD32855.1 FKBP-type peptidyl-prolyl cis-trans isomerase [Polaribacter undariae]